MKKDITQLRPYEVRHKELLDKIDRLEILVRLLEVRVNEINVAHGLPVQLYTDHY